MTRHVTLTQFIARVAAADLAMKAAEGRALKRAAQIVEAEAKREIGHYQAAIGPLAAWAELADATKADRVRQGFSENDPLLRTGELRDSISHAVGDREAVVGSNSDVAAWQELGTERIPPRSFLGGAALRKLDEVGKALAGAPIAALTGADVHEGRMQITPD